MRTRRFRALLAASMMALLLGVLVLPASVGAASASTTCPPPPPPGSTVDGGLLVTGPCTLVNVTVNGGVTVTATGRLELERSTINGGITVQPGGELDSGHTISSDVATGLPSTIHGGITITIGQDVDLFNADVDGKVVVNGITPAFTPTFCGSHFHGQVELLNLTSLTRFGDPGEAFEAGTPTDCPANTLDGSLFVTNSRTVEIEGNHIAGSVHITDSTVEFAGNTFGSAHCTNVTPFTDGDGGIADCTR